jgi:hypothetical protein
MPGIGDPIGETGVGRQQKQPRRREVQPPDGYQSPAGITKNVVDGAASLGIASSRDHPSGLMEQNRPPFGPGSRLAVDNDVDPLRNDRLKWVRDNAAVDADAAGLNGFGSLRPRKNPELRQCAIECHGFHSLVRVGPHPHALAASSVSLGLERRLSAERVPTTVE